MKKITSYLFIIIAILTLPGCEENFDPFTEGKEVIVLNSILRNDTTYQTVYLTKSYAPVGFDPLLNTEDHYVKNADVRVWVGDSVYVFRDTSIERSDTSRYKGRVFFYYHDNLTLTNKKDIEIVATLENGKKLSAKSFTPSRISFSTTSDNVVSESSNDLIKIIWESTASNQFYLPRMSFSYYKLIDGKQVKFSKVVPLKYLNEGGVQIPYYSQPGYSTNFLTPKNVIKNALEEISEGDSNKEIYSIMDVISIEVLTYDNNLTKYYSSTQTTDNLSIRVDENDFTNVSGGLGLFASLTKDVYKMKFYSPYIKSFGYNIISSN